jgi:hypothetical protein
MARTSLWQLIFISLSILIFSQALCETSTSVSTHKICEDGSRDVFGKGNPVKKFITPTTNHRPYPTMSSDTRPHCFREHNGNSHFLSFDTHEWQSALDNLCGYSTLHPDDGLRIYVSPKGLVAWVSYAQDQSGCSEKSPFPFSKSCTDWMTNLVQTCDGPMPEMGHYGYGGGFIQSGPSGCIEYYIAKS